jgi:hypothetical protein
MSLFAFVYFRHIFFCFNFVKFVSFITPLHFSEIPFSITSRSVYSALALNNIDILLLKF